MSLFFPYLTQTRTNTCIEKKISTISRPYIVIVVYHKLYFFFLFQVKSLKFELTDIFRVFAVRHRACHVRNFVRAICTYARAVIIFGFGCVNININMLIVFFTLKNIQFHDVKISCKYARIWIKCDQAYRRTSAMYKYC